MPATFPNDRDASGTPDGAAARSGRAPRPRPDAEQAVVAGVLRSVRSGRWAHGAAVELVLAAGDGEVTLRFTRAVPGLAPGQRVEARGVLTTTDAGPTMTDPSVEHLG